MKRLFLLVFLMGCLTGCSELKIIGGAAVNELRAEAINVEFASSNEPVLAEEKAPEKPVMVAKAEPAPADRERSNSPAQKGAWERH